MKKVIALLTVMVLFLSLLSGCKSTAKDTGNNNEGKPSVTEAVNKDEQTTEDGEWTGEVSHIIMTYLTLGTTPTDLQLVQDAVNEISIKKIGVEVELKPVSAYDAFAQFPLWIGTGEQIDLMMPLMQDLNTYVSQGLVLPLDELIESGAPDIKKLSEEFPVTSANVVDGKTYAVIMVANVYGSGGSYQIAHKYLEESGFDYDPEKIYTLDDLTALFAKVKEANPQMYPAGIVTTGRTNTEFFYYGGVVDNLGATAASGSLVGTDSDKVVNLFEAAEYYDYLEHVREWYNAGYIYPDAATTDSPMTSLLMSGVFNGFFMASNPIQKVQEGGYFGEDTGEILKLNAPFYGSTSRGGWVVPITSKEPEAAVRFLNLIWSDSTVSNLLQWGIEGKHYVMQDKGIGLIDFPEGVDASTSGYYNSLGLYGDTRDVYIWSTNNTKELNQAYTEEAMANSTQGVGFVYDPTEKANIITAIQAILAQYLPALESGSVDLEKYYPEFINALKKVGIDEVIADKQAQFDAWRAGK